MGQEYDLKCTKHNVTIEYYDAEWGPKFVVIELHMAHTDLNFWLVGLPMSQVE